MIVFGNVYAYDIDINGQFGNNFKILPEETI